MKFYIFILLRQCKGEECFIIFKLRTTALYKQIELVNKYFKELQNIGEFVEAYDRIVSSDCSGDSCNNANSWLRIRTNVRRNIHGKCASGRPALFVKTSVNSFVTAPRQRWCSIPFIIPSASQFKEKPPSQNGFFTLGHCCSSPWLYRTMPIVVRTFIVLLAFFTRSSGRVQQDVDGRGVIASQKLLQF